jgi:glyoxylate/hydroxypyruvate reductase A
MSLLINIPHRPVAKLIELLNEHLPLDEIEVWPDIKNPDNVELALVWNHETGSLKELPNLKGVQSFGAGVDGILQDSNLPDVDIARLVDPVLALDMAQYVSAMIQQHRLRLGQFRAQQESALWKPKGPVKQKRVGILGLGELGKSVAELLIVQGFTVIGWSQSEKQIDSVESVTGQQGLTSIIEQSDYLVCLLPLTEQTLHILDKDVFNLMPEHAVLINVARGQHVHEIDLLDALDQGKFHHAVLDVFQQEPLPKEHPFWSHPKITITPHISAVSNINTAVEQLLENYRRVQQGLPLLHCIDRERGY